MKQDKREKIGGLHLDTSIRNTRGGKRDFSESLPLSPRFLRITFAKTRKPRSVNKLLLRLISVNFGLTPGARALASSFVNLSSSLRKMRKRQNVNPALVRKNQWTEKQMVCLIRTGSWSLNRPPQSAWRDRRVFPMPFCPWRPSSSKRAGCCSS
jgi:hypothetical protein